MSVSTHSDPNHQDSKAEKPRRKPVPKALHAELTEYTTLLRALRTQHALDLSAHLSQLPPRLNSSLYEDGESEVISSELDEKSDEEEDRGTKFDQAVDSQSHATDPPSSAYTPFSASRETSRQPTIALDSDDPTSLAGKKRKRSARIRSRNDTWTRWPLLAGDVYPPEFGLDEEVRVIASQVLRHRQYPPLPQNVDSSQELEEKDDDTESDEDLEDHVSPHAIHALSSSTAQQLRSLLSACTTFVPPVEPSLRDRLAPLNWTSVLSAAASNGLASPEVIERAARRLEDIYGNQTSAPSSPQPAQHTLPKTVQHSMCASAAVQRAREKLNSMFHERAELGDGNFLSFTGPREKSEKKKRIRRSKKDGGNAEVEKDEAGETENAEGEKQQSDVAS